jgi:hypothetical protein
MNSITFVLFDKYCPIVDQLGSKDSSRDLQLNCVISYYFYLHLLLHAWIQRLMWWREREKILTFHVHLNKASVSNDERNTWNKSMETWSDGPVIEQRGIKLRFGGAISWADTYRAVMQIEVTDAARALSRCLQNSKFLLFFCSITLNLWTYAWSIKYR